MPLSKNKLETLPVQVSRGTYFGSFWSILKALQTPTYGVFFIIFIMRI